MPARTRAWRPTLQPATCTPPHCLSTVPSHSNLSLILVTFSVPVPPRIGPFSFGELIEGVRTQVQCVIQAGDPPLKLKWMKDDSEISNELGIQITQDAYSSTLAIPRVAREHSGNYTCTATNDGRSGRVTAPLVVSGTVNEPLLSCVTVTAVTVTLELSLSLSLALSMSLYCCCTDTTFCLGLPHYIFNSEYIKRHMLRKCKEYKPGYNK